MHGGGGGGGEVTCLVSHVGDGNHGPWKTRRGWTVVEPVGGGEDDAAEGGRPFPFQAAGKANRCRVLCKLSNWLPASATSARKMPSRRRKNSMNNNKTEDNTKKIH